MLQASSSTATIETGWRKLIWPTDPTEFWTFVVAVVAILGLLSLWFVKKDMRNRTTREAAQTTIDRCNEMRVELIPAFVVLLKEMAGVNVTMLFTDPEKISFESTAEKQNVNAALVWLQKVPEPTRNKGIALMNHLEVWAMSFTHDPALANQKVAFEPCSAVFCQMVMWLYPMLVTQRSFAAPDESGPYKNVVKLYRGWSNEQTKGKLKQLLEHLMRLQSGESLPKPIS